MGRVLLPLFFILVAVTAAALVSCLSAERHEIRTLPRGVWILIILFAPLIGAIAWFVSGRARPGDTGTGPSQPKPPPRPVAPDDDPDFLRGIAAETAADPMAPVAP